MKTIESQQIKAIILEAMAASMSAVRKGQGAGNKSFEVKSDKTLCTATDKASELAGGTILRKLDPDIGITAEEGGTLRGSMKLGGLHVLFDPLDGTKPFTLDAPTSTVIMAVVDDDGKVVMCAVGEPAGGRVWFAESEQGTKLLRYDFTEEVYEATETVCTVAAADPSIPANTVYLDLYPNFPRKVGKITKTVLSNAECGELFDGLFGEHGVIMLGSNGIHHALVANGGAGTAGAITTAIGGPWDVCAVLLVTEAGGHARAYSVDTDGTLTEQHPLKVDTYDILVTATTADELNELSNVILDVKGQLAPMP